MTERSFVEKEGTSSVNPDFRLIALSILELYYEVAKPGGSEREAMDWIVHALEAGFRHSEIRAAVKAYGATVNERKYATPAHKFFALDGIRYHWQQYIKRKADPPRVRGFDETVKMMKKGDGDV